jgi:hypothetical protein
VISRRTSPLSINRNRAQRVGPSAVRALPSAESHAAAVGTVTIASDRHDHRPMCSVDAPHAIGSNECQGEILAPAADQPLTPREPHSVTRVVAFRWVLSTALCSALGLGALALADEASRRGNASIPTTALYWLGLLLIFAPIALRALASDVDRRERLTLIIILGVSLYLVKVLASPDAFTFVDEYIHVRNTQDILGKHNLFDWNPLLPTASYYPGLAALTAGLVDLTGLSMFTAGLLVIGVARVLFCACFYLVAERITGSGRGAAAATLVYMANPMFLAWSSTFAYENLALPLAAFVVWWMGRTRKRGGLASMVVAVVAVIAVTVTHHVVGFALSALLGAWWLAERVGCHSTTAERRRVGIMALLTGSATLIWFFVVAHPAPSYLLTNNLFPALKDTGRLVLGDTAPRTLYKSGGYVPPAWEPVAGFAAMFVLLLALPVALRRAWWSRHRAPVAVAMTLAVAFPLSLVPRLAPNGVDMSGRSSEYVFAGLGCVIGLLFTKVVSREEVPQIFARDNHGGPHRRIAILRRRTQSVGGARRPTIIATFIAAVLATVVFVGNVTIGTPFYERLPEGPNPQGYEGTVQPDVIAASEWALTHLGVNQRFGANLIDSFALATYGEQDTVDMNMIWPIFFAESMNGAVVQHIKAARVQYLLVNWRMTRRVPLTPGYYFSPDEPAAQQYRDVFPTAALAKFSSDPCIRSMYLSGVVQIFDVSLIGSGVCG